MKIHIFGASGSGVTTLGNELSKRISTPYFDCDDYFWEESELPYTKKRESEIRNRMLIADLERSKNWVLGGSPINWGYDFLSMFDLAVFLWVPPEIRIDRVKRREYDRFGEKNFTDAQRSKQYDEFIEWVSGYDSNTALGKTIQLHEKYIRDLQCETFQICGDFTTEHRINLIMNKLRS
ncbi:MAG: AAA family ATPase [Bacteroidetes bacterium]|nr:AAA family ATPase [Bacteroidota bacterium]